MKILKILPSFLKSSDEPISVSIIDSGFSHIPSYAKLYGHNNSLNCQHGDKVLAVFTALDKFYPIKNLKLNLVSYNAKTEYDGLIKALKLLPYSDILSLSIAWEQDNLQIKRLLFEKAKVICVPFSQKSNKPYPSLYKGVINCSYIDEQADYCIHPVAEFQGNSFAVPAIARLLAYRSGLLENNNYGVYVTDLFQHYNELKNKTKNINKENELLKCPCCKSILRGQAYIPLREYPDNCPYCGYNIK